MSRLGAELVLWSSEEFGFVELSDAWTSGSSIMPQKKNPDAAELLRGKAPRVVGHLAALHGVLHALPLTYNKDLQEDKEHLFDSADTLALCLAAAAGMIRGASFRRERMAAAASDELIAATDLADLLVRRGVPFRESHGVVAGLVRESSTSGRSLSEFTPSSSPRTPSTSTPRSRRSSRSARGSSRRSARAGRRSPASRSSSAAPARCSAAPVAERSLPASFYARPVLDVARDLVGCVVRYGDGAGVIVETEAYHEIEPACHAYAGLTPHTAVLFGPPGNAYVYRSYGVHALLNAVCEEEGTGAAVLIRALEPFEGLDAMRARARARASRGPLQRARAS